MAETGNRKFVFIGIGGLVVVAAFVGYFAFSPQPPVEEVSGTIAPSSMLPQPVCLRRRS